MLKRNRIWQLINPSKLIVFGAKYIHVTYMCGGVNQRVSVGHPVGVGAPGTGVAPNFAPTPPLGFPTGA